MRGTVTYRPPRPEELADCALIWHASVNDYMSRLGHPLPPPVLEPALRLAEHLLGTDPDHFRVAVRSSGAGAGAGEDERIVGFGIGLQREHVWFLSQLYVLPAEQRRGIGRALLTLVLPSAPVAGTGDADSRRAASTWPATPRPGVLATCSDSAQPISNALYSRFGIVARMPVFNLVGRPKRPSVLPALPAGIEAVPLEPADRLSHRNPAGPGKAELRDTIDLIDRQVLGYAHQPDHLFLRVQGRTGFLYRTAAGEPLGYGYSSQVGRFGPVALLDETLTAPVISHLMAAIEPRGATSVWVPGANDRAMVALLRAGLRIEGFPAMFCWTRPFAAFDRYLPAALALL
jgi:GNAT superfamily N-acetyltransferase